MLARAYARVADRHSVAGLAGVHGLWRGLPPGRVPGRLSRGPLRTCVRTGRDRRRTLLLTLPRRAEMKPQSDDRQTWTPGRGLGARARRAARPARPGRLPELDRSAGLRRLRPGRRASRGADQLHRHLGVAQLRRRHPPAALQGRHRRSAGSSSAWRPCRRRAAAPARRPRGRRRPPRRRPSPDVDLPASPLDGRCTFDNFVVGKPNELAHAAARRVAEGVPSAAGRLQPAVPLRRRRPRQDPPDARDRLGGEAEQPRGAGRSTSRPSSSCTASSRRCASRTCTASRRCSARSTC